MISTFSTESSQGLCIKDLEDEDLTLLHGSSLLMDENEMESLYQQRIGTLSEVMEEIWNLTNEEVDADFCQAKDVPSVNVTEPERSLQNGRTIIRWVLLFLCLWASFCSISDNALEILLLFIRAVFDSLATVFPVVAGFAAMFPQSLHLFRKPLGIDNDKYRKYVVCPIVQPYDAKKYPNCALRGKSTKLGSVIVLDFLIILSYGPHRNTQGGKAQRALGGEGCNRFVWDGKYPEKGNKKGQNSFKFSFS